MLPYFFEARDEDGEVTFLGAMQHVCSIDCVARTVTMTDGSKVKFGEPQFARFMKLLNDWGANCVEAAKK